MVMLLLCLQGCGVKTQLPTKIEDIEICGESSHVVDTVKAISADQNLSFHYGTHSEPYGTQITFRLIGEKFELELFNSGTQTNYTLRVYDATPDASMKARAENAYKSFREALVSAGLTQCDTSRH
jgi:hypothetical protein